MTEYTFDSFVVSQWTRAALDAAIAFAEGRHPTNPLFLYGRTGSGKTHVLYAIAREMRSTRPAANIVRMTVEELTDRLVRAIRLDQMSGFHQWLGTMDALLLDDLPWDKRKPATREEIFRTIELLVERRVPVIGTFHDRRLDQTIRSRFANVLIVALRKRGRRH